MEPVTPIEAATVREARSSRDPKRRVVPSATTGAGLAGGGRELAGEVEDAAHVGAPEAVDRLVGVADDRQVAAVAGESAQQRHLAGVGVLVLVDEDVGEARPQLVAVHLGLDHRAGDQVGVVDGALVAEDVEVLLEEVARGLELRHPLGPAERDQVGGVEPPLAGAGQHRVDLAGEAAGADRRLQRVGPADRLGVVGQQLLEHDVLLRGAEQAQRGGVQLRRRVEPDQPVGEGVERRAQPGAHRAAEPRGHPVPQLLGGLAGERQREHLVGPRAVVDAAHDRLDQRRGLAGAGAGEDEQRAAGVVDDLLLVLVERRDLGDDVRAHEAVRRGGGHGVTQSSGSDSSVNLCHSPGPSRVVEFPA